MVKDVIGKTSSNPIIIYKHIKQFKHKLLTYYDTDYYTEMVYLSVIFYDNDTMPIFVKFIDYYNVSINHGQDIRLQVRAITVHRTICYQPSTTRQQTVYNTYYNLCYYSTTI